MRAGGQDRTGARHGRSFGHAEVFATLFAVSFLAARFLPLLDLPYECPFLALTGFPCATCGMTHAFVHLAHGEIGAAFQASPLGALAAAGAWAFAAIDALRLALALPLPAPAPATVGSIARFGLVAVAANWAFVVAFHG